MKKIFALLVLFATVSFTVAAQPRAIGVRAGYGIEASYQHSVANNFVEADLGFNFGERNALMVTALYDFVIASAYNFNFYVGPGAQLGLYTFNDYEGHTNVGVGLGVAGQIGVEYEIPAAPINISLDWRPSYHFTGLGWRGENVMLGFRYRF